MTFKKQEEKLGKLYKVNEKYENWKKISGKVWWKSKDRNALVRHMLNNNYAYKKEKILKKNKEANRQFLPGGVKKKVEFYTSINNRKDFFEKVIKIIKSKDSLRYITYNLLYLYDNDLYKGFTKVYNVLNFLLIIWL